MINALSRPLNVIPGDMGGGMKAQNLQQAAEQFEGVFLRAMLQQMRKASDALADGDNPFSSKQQQMLRDFYDDTLATSLASQQRGGIASLIIRQLSPQVEGMERALKLTQPAVALSDQGAMQTSSGKPFTR